MRNLLDILRDPAPRLSILNVAPSGWGKTWFALTAPDPIYVFDVDGRIEGGLPVVIQRKKDVQFDRYLKEDPTSYARMMTKAEELIALAGKGVFPFKTIVLDTVTTLAECAMITGMPESKRHFQHSRPSINVGRTSVDVPVMQDHQACAVLAGRLVAKLTVLPCHVIVNGHLKEKKNRQGELLANVLNAPAGQVVTMPGLFNEVWRMVMTPQAAVAGVAQPAKHWLCTRSDNLHSARTCYADALAPLEEPDFERVYAKIVTWLSTKRKELGLDDGAVVKA